MSGDGAKAVLFGGADAGLATLYDDEWELDLGGCVWKEVGTGEQGMFLNVSFVTEGAIRSRRPIRLCRCADRW